MLVIKDANIWTIAQGNLRGDIRISDEGRIVEIGSVSTPPGSRELDAEGRIVMPGMIDAHGHAGLSEEGVGWEGNDYNEAVDPITPHLRALDGINPEEGGIPEALAGGVTAMCVVPGSANVIGGEGVVINTYGNVVDDMVIASSGGLKVAFGENPKRVYNEQKKSPTTRMGIAALLRESLTKAENYRNKLRKGDGQGEKSSDRDLKMEVLVRVLNREIPLRAHAHRADDIMTAIRIAQEFDVRVVIEHCTEGHKIADRLAEQGVAAVVGPTMTTRSKVELRDRTFDTLGSLHEAGVLFAITLDHPVVHVAYLPLCAALAVRAGLPEEAALRAITLNPAKILNIDHDYGSVEEGKVADLVVWHGHPLDMRSHVDVVLVKGRIAYERWQQA